MLRKYFALLLVAGCSGANETELFDPIASRQSGTETDPGAGTTPVGNDAPPPARPDPGTPPPPPPPPEPTCTDEGSDNGKIEDAKPFDGCFTGTVSGNDTDYGVTLAPLTATKIAIAHEETAGKVSYRVYINGVAATPAFTGAAPAVKVIPGAKYQFQMRTSPSNSAAERTYRLTVTFQ